MATIAADLVAYSKVVKKGDLKTRLVSFANLSASSVHTVVNAESIGEENPKLIKSYVNKGIGDDWHQYQVFIPLPEEGYQTILSIGGQNIYNSAKNNVEKNQVESEFSFYCIVPFPSDYNNVDRRNRRICGLPKESVTKSENIWNWRDEQKSTDLILFMEDTWCMTVSGLVYKLGKKVHNPINC